MKLEEKSKSDEEEEGERMINDSSVLGNKLNMDDIEEANNMVIPGLQKKKNNKGRIKKSIKDAYWDCSWKWVIF